MRHSVEEGASSEGSGSDRRSSDGSDSAPMLGGGAQAAGGRCSGQWRTGAAVLSGVAGAVLMLAVAGGSLAGFGGGGKKGQVSVLVVGDWGRAGRYNQSQCAAAMAVERRRVGAGYVASTGDNFYDQGLTDAADPKFKESFTDQYDALQPLPWGITLGNHDYHGNTSCYVGRALAKRDGRWHFPARSWRWDLPEGREVPLLSIHFVDTSPWLRGYRAHESAGTKHYDFGGGSVVRDNGDAAEWAAWEAEQLAWLDGSLASSGAAWDVVVGHHPIHSAGEKHGDTPELQGEGSVDGVMRRHGVKLYLNGHDHNLQHIELGGVNYVTSGAGSKARESCEQREGLRFEYDHQGFVSLVATERKLGLRFNAAWGAKVLYQHTIVADE